MKFTPQRMKFLHSIHVDGVNYSLDFFFLREYTLLSPLDIKVSATSLKLETRLLAHPVGTNTRPGTEAIFTLI